MFVFDATTGEDQVAVDSGDTGLTPYNNPTNVASTGFVILDQHPTYSTDSKTLLLANLYQKYDVRCTGDPAVFGAFGKCVQVWVNITAVTLVAPL